MLLINILLVLRNVLQSEVISLQFVKTENMFTLRLVLILLHRSFQAYFSRLLEFTHTVAAPLLAGISWTITSIDKIGIGGFII